MPVSRRWASGILWESIMSTKTWYGSNGDWTNSADWIGSEPGGGDAARH